MEVSHNKHLLCCGGHTACETRGLLSSLVRRYVDLVRAIVESGRHCAVASMRLTRGSPLHPGWMTFAPEWLTGSPNLDTSNWIYL